MGCCVTKVAIKSSLSTSKIFFKSTTYLLTSTLLKYLLLVNSVLFVFFSYNWIIMALTYFIPVVVISATSAHMGYILWYKAPVGIVTAPIERARMKKKKVCKIGNEIQFQNYFFLS